MTNNKLKYLVYLIKLFIFLPISGGQAQSIPITNDSISSLLKASNYNLNQLNSKLSLEFAQVALNHAYVNKNDTLTAASYELIAQNYDRLLNSNRATHILGKAYELVKDTDNYNLQFSILNSLASVYKKNSPELALSFYNESLSLNLTKVNKTMILLSKLNIAETLFVLKEFKKGYNIIKSIENEIIKSESNLILMNFHLLKGHYFNAVNKFSLAQNHYNKALSYINTSEIFPKKAENKIKLYQALANFYKKYKMDDWAYYYLKKYATISKNLNRTDLKQSIETSAYKIDNDDYKRQIVEIEKINEEQKHTIFLTKFIFLLVLLIAMSLSIVVIHLYKSQRLKNRLLNEIAIKNKDLEIAHKQAEEYVEMKTQFISKVSHELRTPLYSVIGLTNILQQDYDILRNNKIVTSLKFSSDYLMTLINDLLQLQKIEAKATKIEVESYNIQQELSSIISSLNAIAIKNNNKVTTTFNRTIYDIIQTDKIKLNQILFNLLGNAIKFTNNGDIVITVSQNIINKNTVELHISIQDSGVGIAPENINKVFDKFSQFIANGSEYQGTGLGLSIVKQLVDFLGGDISVFSSLGKGTTFSFFVPCQLLQNSTFNQQVNQTSKFNLKNLSILLVEDNEINRLVNQRILKKYNIFCKSASCARDALQLINQYNFDVILTDINMPEINGFEMSKKMRELGFNMPIIALTAYNKDDIINEVNDSGINDVVTKPFKFDFLIQTIYDNIEQKKSLMF